MLQRRDLLERGALVQGVWLRFGSHFWFLDLETEGGEGALLHWMTWFLGLTAELISVMIQTHIRPGKLFLIRKYFNLRLADLCVLLSGSVRVESPLSTRSAIIW